LSEELSHADLLKLVFRVRHTSASDCDKAILLEGELLILKKE